MIADVYLVHYGVDLGVYCCLLYYLGVVGADCDVFSISLVSELDGCVEEFSGFCLLCPVFHFAEVV